VLGPAGQACSSQLVTDSEWRRRAVSQDEDAVAARHALDIHVEHALLLHVDDGHQLVQFDALASGEQTATVVARE